MPSSVREIHISTESDSAYFLRVDWRGQSLGSGFQMLLTDGQDAWRGEVSEAAVRKEAEELEMPKERYVQDLQQALTESSSAYGFTLTASPPRSRSTVTLEYEKVQKDISFSLGSVLLEAVPEPAEAVRNLLIHSLQRGNTLEHQNQKLEQENQTLRREQQRITTELRRYAAGKEALEAELYSRFVLVLNEKKAKIRSLQEAVTRLQEASSEGQTKRDSLTPALAQGERDAAEDEYGGSTDEEPEGEPSTPASAFPSLESTAPSPLGLKDLTDVAPCRKRRFRHLGGADPAIKRPNPPTSQRTSDSPAGSSQQPTQQAPQSSAHAAAASPAAEDLFEDF